MSSALEEQEREIKTCAKLSTISILQTTYLNADNGYERIPGTNAVVRGEQQLWRLRGRPRRDIVRIRVAVVAVLVQGQIREVVHEYHEPSPSRREGRAQRDLLGTDAVHLGGGIRATRRVG